MSDRPLGKEKRRPKFSLMEHSHLPLLRVVPKMATDILDTSRSLQSRNRWNTKEFPALYLCCGEKVAMAVIRDKYRTAQFVPEELAPERVPVLVQIAWQGIVVDLTTDEGLRLSGLPTHYPEAVDYRKTQPLAKKWHKQGREGVVCRSASLWRLGLTHWQGDHRSWGELVVFVTNACSTPRLVKD